MAEPALALDAAEQWPGRAREQLSLVVQTSFLGDVVLTTPLLAELARRGPVDVVVRPDAAPLLARNPAVRRVIVYDKRGADAGVRGLWRLARQIRLVHPGEAPAGWRPRERVAYLAQGSARSAMLARLAGCGERIGFDTSRQARPLYTRVVRYRADRHHAERLWSLAMPDHARPSREQLRPHLYPGREERHAVDAILASAGPGDPFAALGNPLVALAPGSVWATKRWPYYAELAARLAEHARLVVIGSGADRELAAAIVAASPPGRAVDATGRLALLGSAELIGRAALLVTNDSAPQHLASAMGTPTLTVFGPTVGEFGFGPLAPGSRAVGLEGLACRPCDAHGPRVCPLGHWRCMREQTPDAVAGLAARMLASAPVR